MKYFINITTSIFVGLLISSCGMDSESTVNIKKIKETNRDSVFVSTKRIATKKEREDWNENQKSFMAFLDSVDRIVLSNYECDIHRWNSKLTNKESRYMFNIDTSYYYNNTVINKEDATELFELMHKYDPGDYVVSSCFDPHHVINFYSNGINLGYFKICFNCNLIRSSENFKMTSNLDPSVYSIRQLFRKHGCNQHKNKPEFKLNKIGKERLGK